jgi:hypothetical protein
MHPRWLVIGNGKGRLAGLWGIAAVLLSLLSGAAQAQRLPAFVPPAAHERAPLRTPWPQDSVPRPKPKTYWLPGAILGTALFGLLGASLGAGTCGDSDTHQTGGTCVWAGAEGFLIGGAVGFPLGGLIGGAFPMKSRASPEESPPEHAMS